MIERLFRLRSHWPFLVVLLGLSLFHLWGIERVPFHPDEATQLFMSSDFEAIFLQPEQLVYSPQQEQDLRQRYRLLDAPLTKYLLGLGRSVFGRDALPVDWDWGQSWDQNSQRGALPEPVLLFAGRLAVTLLLPLSLIFAYLVGHALDETSGRPGDASPQAEWSLLPGSWTGLIAALLLGSNALVLLHARRAMAEGVLLFSVLFVLWTILQVERHPWLTGLGLALALNAKQSLAALVPVGLLALIWAVRRAGGGWRMLFTKVLQLGLAIILVSLALNPVYWSQPMDAFGAAIAARRDLLARQVADTRLQAPEQVLQTPGERAAVLLAHLFLLEPRYFEIANYRAQTLAAERAYDAIFGHNLLRSLPGAGVLMSLTLLGVIAGLRPVVTQKGSGRRALSVLYLATLLQGLALLLAVPLAYQRYSMPIVPLATLWAAYGLSRLLTALAGLRRPKGIETPDGFLAKHDS